MGQIFTRTKDKPVSGDTVIRAEALSKCYHLYDRPADRLRQLMWGRRHRYYREFWALHEASFEVTRGEVLGIVGRNGAGKSTLLQLVCGTLAPTGGTIAVTGRVAALLELGAGFHPEFTGRENVMMAASILGLSAREIEARFEQIVDFSGIREFIDQPVKVYSSGMYVRLAFSVATSVDPDILVIDEALAVGDGVFARKSFDRIMALKEAGATILFCSHSLYYVEALCSRVLWLEQGRVVMAGASPDVTNAYGQALEADVAKQDEGQAAFGVPERAGPDTPRIVRVQAFADGLEGKVLAVRSGATEIRIEVEYVYPAQETPPGVGFGLANAAGTPLASAATFFEPLPPTGENGRGSVALILPKIPLLKGKYDVTVFLTCERGLHVYESVPKAISLEVRQDTLEQGMVSLPHYWEVKPGDAPWLACEERSQCV